MRKRNMVSTYNELETILFAWYQWDWASGIHVDGRGLRTFSGWMVGSLTSNNATSDTEVDFYFKIFWGCEKGYKNWNTYNVDETGHFSTACQTECWHWKKRPDTGRKQQQRNEYVQRSAWDVAMHKQWWLRKTSVIVIGKSINPQCFKWKDAPVTYYANSKVQTTSEIFIDFLSALDITFENSIRKSSFTG